MSPFGDTFEFMRSISSSDTCVQFAFETQGAKRTSKALSCFKCSCLFFFFHSQRLDAVCVNHWEDLTERFAFLLCVPFLQLLSSQSCWLAATEPFLHLLCSISAGSGGTAEIALNRIYTLSCKRDHKSDEAIYRETVSLL